MVALQILIDGFAVSALYALGATGFTLIFGVSGVLNLSHGAIMVLAAVAAWAAASGGATDSKIKTDSERGEGDLRPYRHIVVGDHDPGTDRLLLHQQRENGAADCRRRS
jgi:ABC-type branched-subunit amino acid transport system permease subunit